MLCCAGRRVVRMRTTAGVNSGLGDLDLTKLLSAAKAVGIDLVDAQARNFVRYFDMIEAANAQFNLTGARGWERVCNELFIRSFGFLAPVAGGHVPATEWVSGKRILDVGTGAGIPGMVLKLAVPEASISLLDSSRKKTAFLRQVVQELGLHGVEVITGRAEEVARDPAHREAYDMVVTRGVARLVELAELTLPFAAVGGVVVSAKGPDVEEEMAESDWAAELLGSAPAIATKVSGGDGTPFDTMVYWMKIGRTPLEYPRRTGLPHSRPLLRNMSDKDGQPAASVR